ncbi:MAG: putative Ig domain-containing protein [Fuerstiella sp.]
MLIVVCPGCQSKLKVKPDLAGRRLKCPKCNNAVTIPDSADEVTLTLAPNDAAGQTATPQDASTALEENFAASRASEALPSLNLATTPSTLPRSRRRRRSSASIWAPLLLILIAVGGSAIWYATGNRSANNPQATASQQFPDQTVVEGQPLRVALPTGNRSQNSQLKVLKAPNTATLNQATREFSWTPSEADGPGEYDVIIQVVQGPSTTEATFRIIVTEEDSHPEFSRMETVAATPLEEIQVSVKAIDPDVPTSQLVYSLFQSNSQLATTASIDSQSGAFRFTPPEKAAGEMVTFQVKATEQSDAGLSSEFEFKVQVAAFEDPVRQLQIELSKDHVFAKVIDPANPTVLPFSGEVTHLEIDGQTAFVYRYESAVDRNRELDLINEAIGQIGDFTWQKAEALHIFTADKLIIATVGAGPDDTQTLSRVSGFPVAIVRQHQPPETKIPESVVETSPDLMTVALRLYDEPTKRSQKLRKLFTTESYNEVRNAFAVEFAKTFDEDIRTGLGTDYDEVMSWFDDRVDLKEEFFTAIQPDTDNVSAAFQLFNEIRKAYPNDIDRYGSLAIACAVVWDRDRGIYRYDNHARRTHSSMPKELLAGLENFQYFVDTENLMQGRAQFAPWEFLTHLINHRTPTRERGWAIQTYLQARQMFGKCYADVPYDTEMLETSSRVCELAGKEYNLPNIRQFGGVCAMQADFAARVGKSIGVPAAYVSGSGKYGGAHAWVMWVELQAVTQRSIRFSLESHGRYRGDNYYVGNLRDPQSGKNITDRLLALRLHQVGTDAKAKRHADRLMLLYPELADELEFDFETHLEYLSGTVAVNPWSESAWTALSQLSQGREADKGQKKTMSRLLNQLFVNFAVFPDFTQTIFSDLISFEKDVPKRIAHYYQILDVYADAKRPDLSFTTLLKLSQVLEQEQRSSEAIQALAVTIQEYADEGQYVPKMLDRLENLVGSVEQADQKLAEFYANFLPKIPRTRGGSPSKYCIQMYERAVPIFTKAGQQQLAQNYQTGANQMKKGVPQ